jgi:hypothetical protein
MQEPEIIGQFTLCVFEWEEMKNSKCKMQNASKQVRNPKVAETAVVDPKKRPKRCQSTAVQSERATTSLQEARKQLGVD